jgi:hypothetical protein
VTRHIVIPDSQVKPGVPIDHLDWIGRYILEKRPDVIVHLGDLWDMPSLSSYDRGKLSFEGRRYRADVDAGNKAFRLLNHAIDQFNYGRRRRGQSEYLPRRVFLRGNHEQRIERAIQEHGFLDGMIGYDDLDTRDWEVADFLVPITIDGVTYAHYFANPLTGRPYGGMAATRLKTVGTSFTQGHQQVLDYALRFVAGRSQHALIAGSCTLHPEDYLGPQGNATWNGIIVKNQVEDGSYDPSFVSLDYLCRRYEDTRLEDFVAERYPDLWPEGWNW